VRNDAHGSLKQFIKAQIAVVSPAPLVLSSVSVYNRFSQADRRRLP